MRGTGIFKFGLAVSAAVAFLKGMPPGGDAYMEREWRRRSDSLFVEAIRQSDSQLPTWLAMPTPKVSISPSPGTRYVDPNTGQAHWDFAGFCYSVQGTYGGNTTNIPQVRILPSDSVNSDKGLQRVD